MTTTTRTRPDIRRARSDDEPAIIRLLERALAGGPTGRRDDGFFHWKHHDNPFGPSLAFVAEVEGRVVGFRTFMRWRFRNGRTTVGAVRAVDTATDPDHRGQGIFTSLTLHALDQLDGEDLVFNTPNGQSLPGYIKMGWREVGTVPIAIRPVRPLRFLARAARVRRGGGPGEPPPCPFPRAADVLADHAAIRALLESSDRPGAGLTTDRSVEMLWWRYAQAPGLDYRAVTVHTGAELVALAIGRPRMRGGLAEFTLAEVLVRAGDPKAAGRLLRTAARFGGDHVATHLSPESLAARQAWTAGYATPPGVGMTLVANVLRPVHPDPLRLDSWRLSLGDLEVF